MFDALKVSVLVSTLALSACAAGDPDAGTSTSAAGREPQCFNVGQVSNFRQGRADQLFLRVGRDDVYELNGAGCRETDFAVQLALLPDGGLSGSRLCTGDGARLVVPDSRSPAACRVRVTRKLTPEEVAALPARDRP